MLRRYLKSKAVAYFLTQAIKEKSLKKSAQEVGKVIDKISEKQFGEPASEKMQDRLIKGIKLFTDELIKELISDRKPK